MKSEVCLMVGRSWQTATKLLLNEYLSVMPYTWMEGGLSERGGAEGVGAWARWSSLIRFVCAIIKMIFITINITIVKIIELIGSRKRCGWDLRMTGTDIIFRISEFLNFHVIGVFTDRRIGLMVRRLKNRIFLRRIYIRQS